MTQVSTMEHFHEIIAAISELQEDTTVPRNVKSKLVSVTQILSVPEEGVSIKINKALGELSDISDDVNLQAYTRTQIWNIVSMLETI